MVEICLSVTTVVNTSTFLDWLLRVTVPIDYVCMWPECATLVPTSLNWIGAPPFTPITQMSQICGQ
jgi:hypothetical protein